MPGTETIEADRRHRFLDEVNASYASLRQEPPVWSQIAEERSEWDATLADGLEQYRWYESKPTRDGFRSRSGMILDDETPRPPRC